MLPALLISESRRDPWYATRQAYERVRRAVNKGFGSAWRVDAWGGREARLLIRASSYMVCVETEGRVAKVEGSFERFDPAYALATGFLAPRVAKN